MQTQHRQKVNECDVVRNVERLQWQSFCAVTHSNMTDTSSFHGEHRGIPVVTVAMHSSTVRTPDVHTEVARFSAHRQKLLDVDAVVHCEPDVNNDVVINMFLSQSCDKVLNCLFICTTRPDNTTNNISTAICVL